MNKAIIAVVAIIILAGGAFVLSRDKEDKPAQDTASSGQTSLAPPETVQNTEETVPAGNELDPNNYTEGANIGSTVNATNKSEVAVSADDFVFNPTYLKIKKGTTVTWTNNGQIVHTVTSADTSPQKGLDSGNLNNGDTYEFTFNEAGTYEYFCVPHPFQMKAVITAVD
ncbi:MAG TPA: plastocyanin/azurin family copper-binding protein [Candidatus Saccharimonadales bacterium]|nr:plastocyanin/azurin family copper-binding protein [Candidatus Saccharimonadales bacterium]